MLTATLHATEIPTTSKAEQKTIDVPLLTNHATRTEMTRVVPDQSTPPNPTRVLLGAGIVTGSLSALFFLLSRKWKSNVSRSDRA